MISLQLLSLAEITICTFLPHNKGPIILISPRKLMDLLTKHVLCPFLWVTLNTSFLSFAVDNRLKWLSCSFMLRESFPSHPSELLYQ